MSVKLLKLYVAQQLLIDGCAALREPCASRSPYPSLEIRRKALLAGEKHSAAPTCLRGTVDQVLWMFATKCSCPESGVTCVMSQPQQDVYAPCVVGWIYCSFEVLSWMFA